MERTRNPQKTQEIPSLILCSDFHLREDTPTCFTGDWHQEQWKAVEFIRGLQAKYDCPVVHAGDLFHHWKPSPSLISQALWFLPEKFYTIYGQHDLPQHSLELKNKSGLHTLEVAGKINVLPGCHYGQEPTEISLFINGKYKTMDILVWHHLTYILPPFPGATGGQADRTLANYSQFDLIVTGDNHQSFWTNYGKQILVNPGSLTRQTADQIDFKPSVYLWYAESNTVERVFIPVQKDVISREHIAHKEERDARIDAFVSSFKEDYEVGLSFEQNLEEFFNKNDIREPVKQIIWKAIE